MIRFRGVLSALCTMLVPFIMNGQNTVRPDSIQEPEPVDSVGYRGPSKTAEEDTGTGFFKGVIPCSPQAAALARYAEFPVSHTTGIPEISVPLYEIDLGGYKLPISISYHASGARPDEMPTSVGLGWSLNAGGAITRTILGKPDLYNNFNDSYDFKYYNYDNIRDLIYDVNHPGGSPDLMDLYYMVGDYTYPDTESDRYTYNIPGENGVSRYSYEDSAFVVLNNSNRIVRSYGNSSSSSVAFSILDNIGYEYVFGQEEATGVPSAYAEHPFATAWYVTQIITPYGNIDFTYEDAMSVDIQTIDVYADAARRPEYEEQTGRYGETEYITVHNYLVGSHVQLNTCHYGQSILKKIEWNGNRIEFSYVDEHPGKTMQRLIGMKVYNSDGELRKSIGFDNTDNWPTGDCLTGRRLLKSVSDSEAGIWKFEYDKSYDLPPLPLKNPRATCCDLWGYWNTSVPDRYQSVFSKDQWKWLVAGDDHTGEAWHEASKSRDTEYVANKASSVRLYKAPMNSISLVEDGYYAEKTLQGERTIDEDGKEMTVYTDRLGRKVLERRGPESRKGSNDTYFVYNDLGQLRYVLTPGYELSGYKDKFAYEYRYDESGNVVKKFIPGAGYTQYWYDRAGRLTFMQDENLRASGLHRFFVYDKAGRQVIQGVSALCSRGKEVNAAAYTGGSSGFMSTGYTLSDGSRLQQVTLECVNYYDGYDFVDAGDNRLAKSGTASATGLPTGETVYSSDGSRSVSASYYDEKGNIVEQRELTAFGTLRVTTTSYNYSGLPLSTVMTEKDITVQTDNTYHDSTGLLLHTDVTVNGTRQRVSSLTYDDLGRVITDTRGDGAAVTGTSYTYDLHGRVTSISGPGFSQRLHYADGPGNRLYNGMISSMSWTMGNDAIERGYRYSYNDFNWLTAAEYGEGSSLDSHKNRYTERFIEFMPNGGVRRLQRHGLKADGEYGKIDNLHIYYEGNRIKEVLEDAGPTTQTGSTDFSGKTGVRSSFGYNAWGALVRDDSRNISSVAYDNLGNPVGVEFGSSDGRGAKYVYSAKGERLKAEHRVNVTVEVNPVSKAPQLSDGSSAGDISPITPNLLVTTRLEYHGPVVYRNGKVDRVLFSGGYATIDGGNVTFHYYTRDYQGSNRAVVNGTTGAVEQTVAYYPCGGVIADLGTGAGIQPCKFGGKELTLYNGLDEYDFGARRYYPAVPHFTRIDPKCEDYYWLSPYLYCANDPVNNIDPTGEKIIFVNGFLGFGSPDGGPAYWNGRNSAFVKRAQNTLNDHTIPYFTDYDYSYWRSSNSTREDLGYGYARDNYRLITEGMKAGLDKFNFISHSMGGAFSEGMMKYMTEQGWQIEHAIFLNAWEPTEIDTKVEGIRIDATCTNDWVQQLSIPITGDSNIPHSDLRIQIDSNESFMKIHRDLIDGRNNDLWNMINKILSE